MKLTKTLVLLAGIILTVVLVYSLAFRTIKPGFYAYKKSCGGCHLLPDPRDLPKHIWRDKVLPEMAARLGLKDKNYNPLKSLSFEDQFYMDMIGVYPAQALIKPEEWTEVYAYIMSLSPDSLPCPDYKNRSKTLKKFSSQVLDLDTLKGAVITYLRFDKESKNLYVGDAYGQLFSRKTKQNGFDLLYKTGSPVIGFAENEAKKFYAEIGIMPPSEVPRGKIWAEDKNNRNLVANDLHRPVFADLIDLNGDGEKEILVGEFGHIQGQLSLLKKNKNKQLYEKIPLLNLPGILRAIPVDMNADKKIDLVVMATQGQEGIYILYNQGDFKFSTYHVIQLKPHYGASWFELVDYNQDGYLDIALVNGDNADYSITLKPYHGLRIYLNKGNNRFEEAFFYPIYGATRVIARDFDRDKDIDFAVTAYFPDYLRNSKESFIYLENQNAAKYQFEAQTFAEADRGRWLTMEAGDFDTDGDEDILLGSFTQRSPVSKFSEKWQKENVDLMLLRNQLFRKR